MLDLEREVGCPLEKVRGGESDSGDLEGLRRVLILDVDDSCFLLDFVEGRGGVSECELGREGERFRDDGGEACRLRDEWGGKAVRFEEEACG